MTELPSRGSMLSPTLFALPTALGRDFYKVGVPNNGSVNVVTTLAANETNPPIPPGSHLPWWILFLLLGIIFIVVVMRKMRSSHP